MSDFNYYAFLKFKKNEVFALNDLTDDLKARVSVFFDMPNELPFKSRKKKKEEFSPQELLDFKNKSPEEKKVFCDSVRNSVNQAGAQELAKHLLSVYNIAEANNSLFVE